MVYDKKCITFKSIVSALVNHSTMELYTRKQISENEFEVIGADSTIIKNHNDRPYPCKLPDFSGHSKVKNLSFLPAVFVSL